MAATKLKKGDMVEVVAGKERASAKRGKIIRIIKDKNRAVVENVNIVKRHMKPSQLSAGGIVEKEAAIHLSNIALVCDKCDKAVRVGMKILEDGSKVRFCKKCGDVLDK